MFSDPLALTYDAVARSLPRVSETNLLRLEALKLGASAYGTADGGLSVYTRQYVLRNSSALRHEIYLVKKVLDNDSDPFNNGAGIGHLNGVGLTFLTSDSRVETVAEIPKIQASLLALVTASFRDRMIGGEV